jgi:release factor glutamine methyltransferase
MNVGEYLAQAEAQLKQAGIDTGRLDCLVLLEDTLGVDRASLLAHPERVVPVRRLHILNNKIAQRSQHTPLAYLRNKADFYGRTFAVTPDVLVPRPETEDMIDLLKQSEFKIPPKLVPLKIADVGTGSGCLGLTAALEMPTAGIDLYDIDAKALHVAMHNARTHKVQARALQEDLLSQAGIRRYDVILANLPYVPTHHPINKAAWHEPAHAIFAGQDGLDAYRGFWDDIPRLSWQPAYIFTEALPTQHQALARLARTAGYIQTKTKGYTQQFAPLH